MTPCIEHTNVPCKNGYVLLKKDGVRDYVHRHAYREAYGEIPEGMEVCHTCDNRACMNPDHLFAGTRGDNMRDCWKKGRGVVPVKLTDEDVREIRKLRKEGMTQTAIAVLFDVCQPHISDIIRGRRRNTVGP